MNAKTIGSIVVVIIVAVAAWYFLSAGGTTVTPAATEPGATAPAATTPAAGAVTVAYTDNGFSPASVSVAVGTQVTFVNQSSDEMWIASNPHPAHTGYDGTTKSTHCAAGYAGSASFDQCAAGDSFSFTFTKVGTWGYHNHGNANDGGTVVVTAQ
ncbi:hypothetical protein HY091_01960 [Candidatus Kaiserbacteria bacterium]|nr:hypothetical protein [Candidatus Kaiserbacteria bacterium]